MQRPVLLTLLLLAAGAAATATAAAPAASAEAAPAAAPVSPAPPRPPLLALADFVGDDSAAGVPLVEFGTATTTPAPAPTIDAETRALFDALAAGEQQLLRVAGARANPDADATGGKDAKLASLLSALQRTRAKLDRELSDALDEKVFDRVGALRQRLGPKATVRLLEEAQKTRGTNCRAGSFTPPRMVAAKITGPGAFLSVAAPLCTLQRRVAPLQLTLPIACTGAGVLLRETPALYSAATQAPARATTRDCKAERKWGPEGTAEVVIFDPKHIARQFGLLPAEKFNNTGAGCNEDDKKQAWRYGSADVKEAVKGLWAAMLGNVTVKDEPNGAAAWQEKMAAQAEAVRERFQALRSKMERGGRSVVGKSDGPAEAGGATVVNNGTSRRREAELRLRALAAEYLEERLAAIAAGGDGGEDGEVGAAGGLAAGSDEAAGARLAAAMKDLAMGAVEEAMQQQQQQQKKKRR